MASTRSRTQARRRAREKLLSKLEGFLDALTDYEELNSDARRKKATEKRDTAIAKAEEEYQAEIRTLDDELATVVARMRTTTTAEEVKDATGLTYSQQKTLLDRHHNNSEVADPESASTEDAGNNNESSPGSGEGNTTTSFGESL